MRDENAPDPLMQQGISMPGVDLTIEEIGLRGDGMARHAGSRIAVPFALPGEQVIAHLEGGRGEIQTIAQPSAERISPICPHFGQCGGCALQHWAASPLAEWKRNRIRAALAAVGVAAEIAPTRDAHGAGRRRVTLHVRQGAATGRTQAGFMQARSHQLIDLDHCPLLVPQLASAPELARRLGHILRGLGKPLDVQITATLDGLDVDLRGAGKLPESLRQKLIACALDADLARLSLHGERLIEARMPRVLFEDMPEYSAFLPPGSFLQATAAAESLLTKLALEGLGGAKRVADLFCGLGPFGLRLSRKMSVSGYDSDPAAIAAFQRSLRAMPGGKPAAAQCRDLFRRPLFVPELKPFDAVLLDPPRQGAETQVREIAKSALNRLVYVSCDPESFARDAAILAKAGFRLGRVTPVDQFRYSAHVELVAELRR